MVTFVSPFTSQAAADVAFPAMKEYLARAQGKSEAERTAIYEEIMGEMRKKMPKVTVAAVADHIEYIRKLAGVDYIGIGSDYDGNSNWPEGLEDVSMFPNLFAELSAAAGPTRTWQKSRAATCCGRSSGPKRWRREQQAAEKPKT